MTLSIGDRETVLTRNTAVLLIPDGAAPSANDREEIAKWIERGGVAVRFAGPNLATGSDTMVPTPLRLGDRALGGVMSWGQPSALAEFPANSPFVGIPIPKDVRISQQVLAEPTPYLADKTWARLADGTPLVTAEKRGQGWIVLVHTTANADWSNLALSGLFVQMLRRTVAMSQGVATASDEALPPLETLDGFGWLQRAPPTARPIAGKELASTMPSPQHPPGFYGTADTKRALNLSAGITQLKPIENLPPDTERDTFASGREIDLRPPLLTAALFLALSDLLIAYALRGLLRRRSTRLAAVVLAAALGVAPGVHADDAFVPADPCTHEKPVLGWDVLHHLAVFCS